MSGSAEALLAPERGGALLAFRVGRADILRAAPPDAIDPLAMACFPLVPYANRIAHGRFTFAGRNYQLPLNFGTHPHSLHGVGWTSNWTVRDAAEDRITLVHNHPGSVEWPWAYEAVQHLSLGRNHIEVVLSVRNDADVPAPIGLGLHPYFPVGPSTQLRFGATGVWLSTPPDLLPQNLATPDAFGDWRNGAQVVGEELIDHCYEGWDGLATLELDADRQIKVSAKGAQRLHLYRPPTAQFICLEPVNHMPNAINRPAGMDTALAGETRKLSMRIALLEA